MTLGTWLWNVLYNGDRFLNAFLGGDPQETISSRLGRSRDRGSYVGKIGCSILDHIERGHCEDAEEHTEEIERGTKP